MRRGKNRKNRRMECAGCRNGEQLSRHRGDAVVVEEEICAKGAAASHGRVCWKSSFS
jgi:hypothetical protein